MANLQEQFGDAGGDIRDLKFWQGGFYGLSRMVDELEALPIAAPVNGKAKLNAKKAA